MSAHSALSSFAKLDTMGTIKLSDGTATPVTKTLAYDRGGAYSGVGQRLNEIVKVERRGRFVSAGFGNRTYPTITFEVVLTSLAVSSGTGSAADFLFGQNAYSANVSTLGGHVSTVDRPYTTDIIWTIEGNNFGDSGDNTITFGDCYPLMDLSEAQPNVFAFSFEVLGAITGDLAFAQIT